uniref:Ig-like domain-containing protein n=1 Tax=Pundamilia nyererei TaxID=303518 RepID=A0A3B4FMQ2_9CICH
LKNKCNSLLALFLFADTKWKINPKAKSVVIPCTYNYPRPSSKKIINSWLGFWKKGNKVVATSIQKWKLPVEYKKRTQFLGKLRTRNCTMLLDSVRSTDVGPFYFRIEMPQYKSFSYTQNAVSIDVIRNPPSPTLSVEVNDQAYATCSVFHSCPSIPPQFSWSHTGVIKRQWKKVNAWNWQTVSTLTFLPLATDFNKPLNCTVRHRGGKELSLQHGKLNLPHPNSDLVASWTKAK